MIRGDQRSSEVNRCYSYMMREAIRCRRNQTHSSPIIGRHSSPMAQSDAIGRNQPQSDALKPHNWTTVGGERWLMSAAIRNTALQLPNLGGGERGRGVLGRTRLSKVRAKRGRGRADP